ncbi:MULTISPECIES: alpha/beta hydrolase family protein [Paraburkholderia]|uniref:Alpha/beta hydrolase n=1 Tax=Paraburkholderia podalyriae TaxID=1938811 RepID=A0ABR7Q272_9BURK|nr:alpha/beta hydrolase [Paraburkholderia podalyriae]MBC8752623.1 alpha/beta hydrolase [Paraburkholderia podalyriae]
MQWPGRYLRRLSHLLRWRLRRFLFVAFGVWGVAEAGLGARPALGPFENPRPGELNIPVGNESFDPVQALNGSLSSPEHCARVPDSLWVEVNGKGDCIRYYAHGLSEGENPTALVYFSGDVMLRTAKGVRYITQTYRSASPTGIGKEMADWSADAGAPALYLARPGIYGSSGDHNMRRTHREIELMDRALDLLKKRYNITSFILAGHSAGGQIVAALLNRRQDIAASVLSSGLVSVKQVTAYWEFRREIPGRLLYDAQSFYDPVDDIGHIRRDPLPQIYLISDPEDRTVPFYSQLYYVRRLRGAGLRPHHIYAHAPGPQRHLLARHAKRAAALLAQRQSAKEIRMALARLDLPQVR